MDLNQTNDKKNNQSEEKEKKSTRSPNKPKRDDGDSVFFFVMRGDRFFCSLLADFVSRASATKTSFQGNSFAHVVFASFQL
jgi:hypothetical protein